VKYEHDLELLAEEETVIQGLIDRLTEDAVEWKLMWRKLRQ
jgi:hypothetical protein